MVACTHPIDARYGALGMHCEDCGQQLGPEHWVNDDEMRERDS